MKRDKDGNLIVPKETQIIHVEKIVERWRMRDHSASEFDFNIMNDEDFG